jgi:hypothetical protein
MQDDARVNVNFAANLVDEDTLPCSIFQRVKMKRAPRPVQARKTATLHFFLFIDIFVT